MAVAQIISVILHHALANFMIIDGIFVKWVGNF